MGLFRELRFLHTVLKWCAMYPYIPPPPTSVTGLKFALRVYFLRVGTVVLLLLTIAYMRLSSMIARGLFLRNVSYIMWLMAVMVDTFVIALIMLANVVNVTQVGALVALLQRMEQAIEDLSTEGSVYTSYRSVGAALLLLCVSFHSYVACWNFDMECPILLRIHWEVLVVDIYLIHVVVLLLAVGQCAQHLRRMLHDAVASSNVTDVCAVLRLRDDLVRAVALVNRIYGVFFLGSSVSWVMAITAILYFDFVLGNAFDVGSPFLFQHTVMFVWKCILAGGLLMLAEFVTARVKAVTQAIYHCRTHPSNNSHLAKVIEKALLKCQFQEIRFSVYGLFSIDNSLSYTVICSIVTYLVMLIQFRQLEEQMESGSSA